MSIGLVVHYRFRGEVAGRRQGSCMEVKQSDGVGLVRLGGSVGPFGDARILKIY
jgi:hypothetical protein